jgi:hypothetical protein
LKARQYIEEQIIAVRRECEAGAKVADLCRKIACAHCRAQNICPQAQSMGFDKK